MQFWQAGRFQIEWDCPKVMGIVNVTPDSFSDGGCYSDSVHAAIAHARCLLDEGADILDIGGESTRPNAEAVSLEEEWLRVAPILRELSQWQVPISLDTRRTEIMSRALQAGWVDIINDVQALEDEGAVALLARYPSVGICLMHMQGLPENMQNNPNYHNVVQEVAAYLLERANVCQQAGIARERLLGDVGFCFGKTLRHNIDLFRGLREVERLCGLQQLVGVSRKSMIGELSGVEQANQRVMGSVAAALFAVQQGAKVIRVHDVRETVEALKVWQALSVG